MSTNPLVLGLHFLLELAALGAAAYWGWTQHAGIGRWAWAIGLPLVAAVLWAIFRAAADPQPAVVEIPGPMRLGLELVILGGAAALLAVAGQPTLALGFAGLIAVDYALSYDRVGRLLLG